MCDETCVLKEFPYPVTLAVTQRSRGELYYLPLTRAKSKTQLPSACSQKISLLLSP